MTPLGVGKGHPNPGLKLPSQQGTEIPETFSLLHTPAPTSTMPPFPMGRQDDILFKRRFWLLDSNQLFLLIAT